MQGHAATVLGRISQSVHQAARPGGQRIVDLMQGAEGVETREAAHDWVLGVVTRLLGRTEVAVFEFVDRFHLQVAACRGTRRLDALACRGVSVLRGRIAAAAVDGVADFEPGGCVDDDLPCEWGMEAVVPLRAGLQLLGAVAVYTPGTDPGTFSESDRSILLAIGRHGGELLGSLGVQGRHREEESAATA